MMSIEIKPASAQKKYQKLTKKIIKEFLKKHQINPDIYLSIHFVNAAKIKGINQKFRKIDRATDILSFPIWENLAAIPKKGTVNLGDIFINRGDNLNPAKLKKLIVHCLNHLIGKHH